MTKILDFQPVIIVGAARSGTNMLRDALTQLPGVATWPCDEINYIWRHHHATFPTDELQNSHATKQVRSFVRNVFMRLARRTDARWVVEKTCANSLRVDYVRAIFPEAKFIFLVRDGRDVVASAVKRWQAKFEPGYILKKARFVPWSDLPLYGWQFLRNRAHRILSREMRVRSWGPRFTGIDELLKTCSLPEVCAEQWRLSVDRAASSIAGVRPNYLHTVRYEDFVQRPVSEFARIAQFLRVPHTSDQRSAIVKCISTTSLGNWRSQIAAKSIDAIMSRLRPTLEKWGYVDRKFMHQYQYESRAA
jgi:hypothetical protein